MEKRSTSKFWPWTLLADVTGEEEEKNEEASRLVGVVAPGGGRWKPKPPLTLLSALITWPMSPTDR